MRPVRVMLRVTFKARAVARFRNQFARGQKTIMNHYCYCAYVLRISRYSGFPIGNAFKYSDIFVRFNTIRRK